MGRNPRSTGPCRTRKRFIVSATKSVLSGWLKRPRGAGVTTVRCGDNNSMSRSGPSAIRILAPLVVCGLLASACGGEDPSEIALSPVDRDRDDTFYTPASGSLASDGVYVVHRDNPVITGTVRLTDPELTELSDGRFAVCCERVLLRSSPPVFYGGLSDAFPAVVDTSIRSVETNEPDTVWSFRSPAVHMPADGSRVELILSRRSGRPNEPMVTNDVHLRLASRIIVLPVHVHEFVRAGSSSVAVDEDRVRAIFDGPVFLTESTTHRDATAARDNTTTITKEVTDPNEPPDRLWDDAEIQFRLASYETVPQRDGLEERLINNDEASGGFGGACRPDTRLARYHSERKEVPGIHVYFGGSIDSNMLGAHLAGGACGAHSACRTTVDDEDFILIDGRQSFRVPNTLAHELGHFLGLEHSTINRSCGALLLDDPGSRDEQNANLMVPGARGVQLTPAQRERAREVACAATAAWRLDVVGCR